MAIQKITADVISSDAITTASISDSAITAAKLAGTLDLTGKTITIATASSGDNDTSPASTAFVQQEIALLVDSAPGTLNTLNELAAALGDDANFSTTVTNSIALKAPLATPQFTNRVGIGVAAHATASLNITTTNQHIRLNNGSELGIIHVLSTGELELWGHGDGESINFRTGSGAGTVAMNVIGNNVGISNTSTLNANLHIGSASATGDATNPALQIGGATTYRLGMYTTAEGGVIDNANGDDGLQFHTKNAGEAVRITADGNLKFLAQTTNFENPGFTYHTNNFLYLRGGSAGLILADDSSINTIQIADGSSGFIKFETGNGTERMRIDSDGNLFLNTTSAMDACFVSFRDHSDGEAFLGIEAKNDSNVGIRLGHGGTRKWIWYSDTNDNLIWYSNAASTERMRISSSGCVGIGSTVDRSLGANIGTLVVNGSAGGGLWLSPGDSSAMTSKIYAQSNGSVGELIINNGTGVGSGGIIIQTNSSEKMRIGSNGNVGIGIANQSGVRLYVDAPAATHASVFRNSQANFAPIVVDNTATSGTRFFMSFRLNNTEVGKITSTGSSTTYATTSDYRAKENVVEMTGALDRVNQLQPKRFNFISDADTTVDGFLAHEVQDIVPEAVIGEKDVVDDEGNPEYQGIDQSKLVPLLTKAIQEQQTIIEDLKSRIETLEG